MSPKYSTSDSNDSGNSESSCEMCGSESNSLSKIKIEGATLSVCKSCKPHDEGAKKTKESRNEESRSPPTPSDTPGYTISNPDSSWAESGRDYNDDPTPYLKRDYKEIVENCLEEREMTPSDVAKELEVSEKYIVALINGNAVREDVPGSVVDEFEEHFDVELAE